MKHVELQEFFAEGSDQKASHVLLHITEPSTQREEKNGYFFAVVEIHNGTLHHIEMVQQIIDDIETGYYEGDHDPTKQFETTLECVNRRSQKILNKKDMEIHALVGTLRGYDLAFSYRGDITGFINYSQKDKVQTVPIIDNKPDVLATKQLFPNLIQGNINPTDYIYIGTPHVKKYISHDRISKLLFSRSIGQVGAHMEKVLNDLAGPTSFGGLIIHMLPKRKQVYPVSTTKASAASLDKLITSKKQTKETLSPLLAKEMIKKIKSFRKKKSHGFEKKKHGAVETNYRKNPNMDSIPNDQGLSSKLLIWIGRSLVYIGIFLWKVVKYLGIAIIKLSISLFIIISNKNNSRKQILHEWRSFFDTQKRKIDHLPLLNKLILLLIFFAVIIFGISIAVMQVQNHLAIKAEAYNQLVETIEAKKDDAEAKIIYRDDKSALVLLLEAKELLATLPTSSNKQKQTHQELSEEITNQLRRLQKIEEVTAEQVSDLSNINIDTTGIGLIQDQIIVFGHSANKVGLVNIFDGSVQIVQNDSIKGLLKATTPKEDDEIVFIQSEQGISRLDANTKNLIAGDISYPNDTPNIIDGTIYSTRLYTLDTSNNTIYKHNKTQTGYDRGNVWLKDTADFTNATGMTIDGNIYVLHKDGEVSVFERGRIQDFVLQPVDPVITEATQVWTYADVDEIFIFEPSKKRIIVYNKQGTLIKQITSDTWQNPQSMVIDDKRNKVYILDGNKIYSSIIR